MVGREVTSDVIRRLSFGVFVAAWLALIAFGLSLQPSAQGTNTTAFNRCLAVTTSDTVDLPPFTANGTLTGLVYVGGAGNVTAVFPDGGVILFTAPPVGAQLPIGVRRINATGTTATVLVACYRL